MAALPKPGTAEHPVIEGEATAVAGGTAAVDADDQ